MKHTIITLVEDKPGVLNRVVSLFRRRNYNITSLTVGPSEMTGISRMTIVTDEPDSVRQGIICKNLLKLINVIEVKDVTRTPCVVRENVLIKLEVNGQNREEVKRIAKQYDARIADDGSQSLVVEVSDKDHRIESLIEKLRHYHILEIVRSGKIAMIREHPNSRFDSTVIRNSEGLSWTTEQLSSYLR